ncbi:MAG: amidohydrolase family protein [Gammaproteobacteria bacterium]|jgi:imidazolonepropionase-like amidohydrolase
MKNLKLTSLLAAAAFAVAPVAGATTYAITGGVVHTLGKDGVIKNGTVIITDGKIAAVGQGIPIPADAVKVDAKGKVITPGLMDAYGYMGTVEISLAEETVDNAVSSDRYTAAFNVADAINPRSTLIPINRIEGVTRAMSAPSAEAYYHEPNGGGKHWNLIAGQGDVIQLGSTSNYIVRNPAAMFAVLGEEGASLAGGSRAAAMLHLREVLQDTRDYMRNKTAYERNARRAYAVSRLDLEAMIPVLQGKLPLVVSVDRASDIEAALRLAKDFGLKLVVQGGDEAWMVADDLAKARVPVILNPFDNLPARFESLGATEQNAAALNAKGVMVAFSTGDSHNARNTKQAAGNAVANGLPWEVALKALTVNPATIYGVADHYGTLEPGMDADVVVWSGDPLEVTTFADRVFIQGRDIPMQSRQTLLRDRYLKTEDLPQQYDKPEME